MLTAKKNGTHVDLTYTSGDTFKFGITTEEEFNEGVSIRFQVMQPNGQARPIIDKTISVSQQPVVIALSSNEAKELKKGNIYEYRLTFLDLQSNIITKISGDIDVRWGV